MMDALHSDWHPHKGQIRVGAKLFNEQCKRIFIQCGRKWGKTEFIIYSLWRYAQSNPGSSCYYISPYYKQSKEIIWSNKRLQNFGLREWLLEGPSGINNTELRLNFVNDSFIKCDGSDNWAAYDGITPHIVIYDEFRDFRPEFHERMAPNLAVKDAPLIIIGTPPNRECQYTELVQEFKEDAYSFWYNGPTWENPHIDPKWLGQEKARLIARGEADVWMREYEAKFIRGGSSSIFPMFRNDFINSHNEVLNEIRRDMSNLQFCCVVDPGTASCTAVLFMAYNPYNSRVYFIDEIYCTDPKENTVNKIGEELIVKKHQINRRHDWHQACDEAATWFIAEMADRFDEVFMPTEKHLNKKESGLSLMKDAMLADNFVFSDKCKKLVWEIENYVKDKNGKIPKEDDHLIDCVRYGLAAVGYSLNNENITMPEVDRVAKARGRMIPLEHDMHEWHKDDMTFSVDIGEEW